MFDISGPELLTILLIALIVFGPRRLPDLSRQIGQWMSEIRQSVREMRNSLDKDVKALSEPLQQASKDITDSLDEVAKDLPDAGTENRPARSGYQWVGPRPQSGPTPEEAMEDLAQIEAEESEEEAS